MSILVKASIFTTVPATATFKRFDRLIICSIFKKSCKNDGVPQKPPKLVKTYKNSYIYDYNVNIGHSINTCNSTSNINAISRWDKNGPNLPILAGIVYI